MKGRYEDKITSLSNKYAAMLRKVFGEQRILGPDAPGISRIKNMYIRQIMLKIEREASTTMVRQYLNNVHKQMTQDDPDYAKIMFYYDVDPQ